MNRKPDYITYARRTMQRPDKGPILDAVLRLFRVCDVGRDELASELFVLNLYDCVCDTVEDIDTSNADGLGLDAVRMLGYRLEDFAHRVENLTTGQIERRRRRKKIRVAKSRKKS